MATYIIGDVQGCFYSLTALFNKIAFKYEEDEAIFLGDLVNRGPHSLLVLRFLYNNQNCLKMVLGNHDIFALAMYYKCVKSDKPHTLNDLLQAPDAKDLFDWLKKQPIIISKNKQIFVHAGLFPGFSLDESLTLSQEVSQILQGPNSLNFLSDCFSKRELTFSKSLNQDAKYRLALWANTRMRMCITLEQMDASYDGEPKKAPDNLIPWFELCNIKNKDIYFGHWAALGLFTYKNFTCLDTGCAWGKKLTALRLEDKKIFQINNIDQL